MDGPAEVRSPLDVRIEADAAHGDVYALITPFTRCGIAVPAGFRSDGASVPRFFWRAIFPPGDAHALAGAILHDYLYRTHPDGWTRVEADRLFREVIRADGVPARRAWLAWIGVRLFGFLAWKGHAA